MRDIDLDPMDRMMAQLDQERSSRHELTFALRPVMALEALSFLPPNRGQIGAMKRTFRNELNPSKAVTKRRAAQKAQRTARRRNRRG